MAHDECASVIRFHASLCISLSKENALHKWETEYNVVVWRDEDSKCNCIFTYMNEFHVYVCQELR